jgi:hypothetical protein
LPRIEASAFARTGLKDLLLPNSLQFLSGRHLPIGHSVQFRSGLVHANFTFMNC